MGSLEQRQGNFRSGGVCWVCLCWSARVGARLDMRKIEVPLMQALVSAKERP